MSDTERDKVRLSDGEGERQKRKNTKRYMNKQTNRPITKKIEGSNIVNRDNNFFESISFFSFVFKLSRR